MSPLDLVLFKLPGLLLLGGAVVFAGISARKRKEHAVFLLFLGLALQLVGMICSQAGVLLISTAKASGSTLNMTTMGMVTGIGGLISIGAAVVTLVAWILFARNRPENRTGRNPPPPLGAT